MVADTEGDERVRRWWRVLDRMRKGVSRIADWGWNHLLLVSPFAPVLLFYTIAPVLITFLYASGATAGFDTVAAETRMPWFAIVGIFIAAGFLGSQTRNPRWRAIMTLPMLYYAFILLKLILAGTLSIGAAFSALFLATGGLSSLVAIRLYVELEILKRANRGVLERVEQKNESNRHSSATDFDGSG